MRKNSIIRNMSIVLCCFISIGLLAQSNKTVTLVVSGEAKTKDEATKQALRSAIEQAFGTFVSAHTEVLNDELIQDEIVSISTGNIAGYKEVNYTESPDGSKSITLEATVSIGELTNFAKSKGMSAELAGETFAMNMRIKELNKKNEIQAIADLRQKLQKMSSEYKFFDYNLIIGEPYLSGNDYAVKATVEIKPNINLANFRNAIVSTLKALSLSKEEQEEYKKAKIPFQTIEIRDFLSDNNFFNTINLPFGERERRYNIYIRNKNQNPNNSYYQEKAAFQKEAALFGNPRMRSETSDRYSLRYMKYTNKRYQTNNGVYSNNNDGGYLKNKPLSNQEQISSGISSKSESSQERFIEIALRNTDLYYLEMDIYALLLRNEFQFAISNNIGERYFSTCYVREYGGGGGGYVNQPSSPVSLEEDRYGIKKMKAKDIQYCLKYGTNEFYIVNTKGQTCEVPYANYYTINVKNFDFLLWYRPGSNWNYYKETGMMRYHDGTYPAVVFEMKIPQDEFARIKIFDLTFESPHIIDERKK